ncbi:hypothetical protein BD413DRAFT_546911 [Trametes elegans]|nr:hypothetical protein BD413DRAFT_546911 [Trametes elegans]
MAKSTRSKVKRAFRAKKRTEGVYAATEAARLHRLHMKLKALTAEHDGDEEQEEDAAEGEEGARMDTDGAAATSAASATAADGQSSSADNANGTDAMDLDGAGPSDTTKRISTHGPRNSRREQWRLSKGLPAWPKPKGMNRQGLVAARRKSGRSHRRR